MLERMSQKGNTMGRMDDSLPTPETLKKLQALSTRKLQEIVKSRLADAKNFGESQSELIAAQELLDQDEGEVIGMENQL